MSSDTIDVSISMSTHVGDDATETDDLSPTEYGIHCRLRRALWRRGGVLDGDRSRLRRLVGAETDEDVAALDNVVSRLWTATTDGKIAHLPTVAEIERMRSLKTKRADAGRAGGQAKAKQPSSKGQANDTAKTCPPTPTPPPSPTPSLTPTPETDMCPAGGPAGPVGAGGDVPVFQLVPTEPTGKPTKPDSLNNVYAVIKHYRERWNHTRAHRDAKTSKARPLIEARLKEGATVEEICQAIDGYHLSPWHQGQNDRGIKYLDLELIVKDETHVLKGIEMAQNPPKPSNGTRPAQDPRVGRAAAEDYTNHPVGEQPL
jgi:uncharacterized protein YdaU (DUF1376 family)